MCFTPQSPPTNQDRIRLLPTAGGIKNAGQDVDDTNAYHEYATDMQMQGQAPLPKEQWRITRNNGGV